MIFWETYFLSFKVNQHNMRATLVAFYLSIFSSLIILPPTTLGDDWSASCPSNCTCKWTNGKKSAICSSLELTSIPTTLSTEIQVLVLNDNQIAYLNREEFINLGLLNLQRIYLKKSNIQYIHKETFKNLKILVEIDLSDNKIEMLDKDTFMGNDRLRILYLNGNPIKKLVAYQFPILPHLRTLDLHDCLINYIDPLAFANLKLLEFLYLKNNLLENLSEYVFQHMTNLKTLVLDDNPWQCNCKLRNFRSWYIKSKLNSISLTCKGPFHHKSKQWENIDDSHFGCQPKVEIFSNEDVQNIDIGTNTTFSCLIYGDPLPEVTWELNGKNFDNDNILFDQEMIASDKLWSNLTVFNMTSLDAGTYTCSAQNVVGISSQNISIYLTEIVQHVLVKTPETFWYFGLIMGTFGTVFLLILLSFVVCLCKRQTRRRRHPSKNIKGSVSFNDQEKKLLDLSITTTNDRGDSCGIDNNTPSINKTESVIGFEPIEITVENRSGVGNNHHGAGGSVIVGNIRNNDNVNGPNSNTKLHGPTSSLVLSTSNSTGPGGLNMNQNTCNVVAGCVNVNTPSGNNATGTVVSNCGIPEEFPLNVGVFPPPPEFCSNVVAASANPAYGNIFISVSVTQDMLDSSDMNIYPDLLNIPKRVDNSTAMQAMPMNVSSFATLPRNHRRGILKKDTNLYPHDEIVSYHNLDTSYCQPANIQLQDQQQQHQQQQQQQQQQHHQHQHQHHQQQQQQQHQQQQTSSRNVTHSKNITTPSATTACINCMKAQPHPYVKEDVNTTTNQIITQASVSSPPPPPSTVTTGTLTRQCSLQTPSQLLNYDNMGRRITASGNSTLSLPDEEQRENEELFNEANQLRTFKSTQKHHQSQQTSSTTQQQQQQQQQQHQKQHQQQQSSTQTSKQTQECMTQSTGSDFVSL